MESNSTAFLIKIKLRHSLGRPSRSDFVQSDFYCKGNAVLINYVESMKDSLVVGLRCLLFCRKLVKRENIVTENLIKNHNMFSKNEFRQFIYEFRHFRKFCNKYDIIQIQSKKK